MGTLFFLQLRGELYKLFARKRTYIGFGVYVALEIAILALFQIPKVRRTFPGRMITRLGGVFEEYFSGQTLGLIVLMATFLLTMLYLALVGGDLVAKEVEDGTMRMTLCRPVSRVRLLLVKYAASIIYTFALIFFVGASALAMGYLKEGDGGLFVWAPDQEIMAMFPPGEGYARYFASWSFLALSSVTITTAAFVCSCFNMKPATATIVSLSYFMIDWIFFHLPYFEAIKEWFITGNMTTWANIFRPTIAWSQMLEDYAYLFGVNATLVIIAIVAFSSRDFKS
jgi:ABC-2 type transport system permease protein